MPIRNAAFLLLVATLGTLFAGAAQARPLRAAHAPDLGLSQGAVAGPEQPFEAAGAPARWRMDEPADEVEQGPGWVCGPLPCFALETLYSNGYYAPDAHLEYLGFGVAGMTSLLDMALVLSHQRPLALDTSVDLGALGTVKVTPGLRGFALHGTF